jgi:hypothetical protein
MAVLLDGVQAAGTIGAKRIGVVTLGGETGAVGTVGANRSQWVDTAVPPGPPGRGRRRRTTDEDGVPTVRIDEK